MAEITKSRFIVNLGLVIISTVCAILIGEIAIRALGWKPMYVSPERDRFWKYDPALGWSHNPGQEGVFETPQFRTVVSINSHGMRDREYNYERSEGKGRILVLGDSFAWGYGVGESERFSEVLENSMGIEVINSGVSGYSTDQELIWFTTEGVKYTPDLVIVVLAGNDVGDNTRDLVSNIYYKPVFVLENGHLVQQNYPVPRTSFKGRSVYYFSQHSALFYFLVQQSFDLLSRYRDARSVSNNRDSSGSKNAIASQPFELTSVLLKEIQRIAASKEAQFLIVATDSWWNGPEGLTFEDFMETLRSEGFTVLDVKTAPGFDPERMLIPDDGHWNAAGHEFVAEMIKNFIESDPQFLKALN